MYAERHTLTLTADGQGAAVAFTPAVRGRVLSVVYVKGGLGDSVSFDVSLEATGEAVLGVSGASASAAYYPRAGACDAEGAAVEFSEGVPVPAPVVAAHDRVKVEVEGATAEGSGTFHVIVG